ncbi:hypothetical protein H8958_021416 [Nasalis larvatus]
MSFILEFHFEPNDYFTNSVLRKTCKMKSEPDKADPFSFAGPEIMDCDGCTIDWKKGKKVTVKIIKKKQKHKGRGTVRTITKQVSKDDDNFDEGEEEEEELEGEEEGEDEDDAEINPNKEPSQLAECKQQYEVKWQLKCISEIGFVQYPLQPRYL